MLNLQNLKQIAKITMLSLFMVGLSGMGQCNFLQKMFGCKSENCSSVACSKNNTTKKHADNCSSKDWVCLGTIVAKESANGESLATIKGCKSIGFTVELPAAESLTKSEVESRLAMFAGGQLPADFSLSNLPPETLKNMVDEMLKLKLIVAEHAEKVLSKPDVKQLLADRIKLVVDGFIFEEYIKATREELVVSNKEIEAEYNNNKARYVKEIGGVTTIGCRFEDSSEADEFATIISEKAVTSSNAFNDEAKAFGKGSVRDFNRISKEVTRGAHDAIVNSALATKRFPSVEVIKISPKEAWTLLFADSKQHTYFSLDERREWIKRNLEQKKAEERFSSDAAKYKEKLSVEMSQAYNELVTPTTLPISPSNTDLDQMANELASEEGVDGQEIDDEMMYDQQFSPEELQALIKQAQDEENEENSMNLGK